MGFQSFWIDNLNFVVKICYQFLELTDITTYIQSHLWLFLTTIAFGLKEIVENWSTVVFVHVLTLSSLEVVDFAIFWLGLQEMKRPVLQQVYCPCSKKKKHMPW